MRLPKLTPLSAQAVAQALEWSGYGPAVALSDNELQIRIAKREAPGGCLDFRVRLLPDGSLEGFYPSWTYQNALPPMVRSVLTIVTEIFMQFGDHPFYEASLTENFEGRIFKGRSTYLWMLPSADPGVRLRLVLNEFQIRGEKVWVQLDVTDYDNPLYANFYVDLGKMILGFKAHGKLPRGIRLHQVNDCISQCLPSERV